MTTLLRAAVAAAVLLTAMPTAQARITRAPAPESSPKVAVETHASGLSKPWAFQFLPDGRILVNEIRGRMRVVEKDGRLAGIITDGDLRRHMTGTTNLLDRTAAEVMTANPVTIPPDTLAAEALLILEQRKITSIVVVKDDHRVLGVVHLHDLWRTGLV